jgi:hypothetical protein
VATRGGVDLSLPEDVYAHLAECVQYGTLTRAWYDVSGEALLGLLSTIRTRIVEFTLELDDAFPNLEEGIRDSQSVVEAKVSHIFNVTIMGTGNVINLGGGSGIAQNIQQQVNVGDYPSLQAFLREHGVETADLDELDAIIPDARSNDLDNDRSRLRQWVDKVTQSLSGGSRKLVQEAVKELVLLSIRYYFGEVTGAPESSTSG